MVGAQNLIGIDRTHGSVCRFTVSHGAAHHGAALGREVAGVRKGDDRYGRVLATGFVGGESLNDRIVREGWALGLLPLLEAGVEAEEEEAKRRRAGLWRGDFEPRWEWRRRD